MKNSNDTIENRTRDLPDCSAVPQPTAPPRAPTDVLLLNIRLMDTQNEVRGCHNVAQSFGECCAADYPFPGGKSKRDMR